LCETDAEQVGNLHQRSKDQNNTAWKLLWVLVGAVAFTVVMYNFGLI
jgi:hypothetical protein